MALYEKLGFASQSRWRSFLITITSGQIIYACFEAFKASFYTPLRDMLGVSNTQFGLLFTLIGTATFFYAPGAWLNNRFSVKKLLLAGMIIRLIGTIYMVMIPSIPFSVLAIICLSWGVVDGFFWPAVLNGTRLFSEEKNLGLAFGLLESVRRAMEMGMNVVAIALFSLLGGTNSSMRIVMLIYTIIIFLWVLLICYGLKDEQYLEGTTKQSKNKEAWKGFLQAIVLPEVWLGGIIAMAVYVSYISGVIYSVPFMQDTFGLTSSQAAVFGVLNASGIGVIGGLVAGYLSDKVFHSPTKLLLISMILGSVLLIFVLLFSASSSNSLYLNMILLFIFSFITFISRSIFFAPLGEAKIPKKINGAAMSFGSLLAYSPVFWTYGFNGYIMDSYNTGKAYNIIFGLSLGFLILGVFAAILLHVIIKKKTKLELGE